MATPATPRGLEVLLHSLPPPNSSITANPCGVPAGHDAVYLAGLLYLQKFVKLTHIRKSLQDETCAVTQTLGLGELPLTLHNVAALKGWEPGLTFSSCQKGQSRS